MLIHRIPVVVTGLLALGMAVLTHAAIVPTALANLEPNCEEMDLGGGRVVIICEDDGPEDGGDDDGDGEGDGDGGGSRACEWGGEEIPCTSELGVWNGHCYIAPEDPQPDYDAPIWEGRTEGVIVRCSMPEAIPGVGANTIWVPYIPGADGPDAEELARRAVAAMNLSPGQIGTTPPEGSRGVIGLPTWLWITNPAENTTGPITRSSSDSGLTVTATATLDSIVYDMGDGSTVTCAGQGAPGTPYTESAGDSPSPTCGHTYESTGQYTISATNYWTVEWSGSGQTGTIPMELTGSVDREIGEVQSVVTGG